MKQFYTLNSRMFKVFAVISLLAMTLKIQAATLYVGGGGYASLSAAIAAANPNDIIVLTEDISEGIVLVNKSVTIDGQYNGVTHVLTSTSPDRGIVISAVGVSVQNLIVEDAGTFGIQVAPGANNVFFSNVHVNNSGRLVPMNGLSGSGFSITGVDGAVLMNVSATNNKGNGISITSSQNVIINGVTTSGNSFYTGFSAGIGIFSSDAYTPCSTDGVQINAPINISELVLVYQEDNETDACASPNISNVSIGMPIMYFSGACTSSDGAWTTSLANANAMASGLDFFNTAYSTNQMFVFDVAGNQYFTDNPANPGFDADPNSASANTPCPLTPPAPVAYTCDILPEIGFTINGVDVIDDETVTINVCDANNNVTCDPNALNIVNIDDLGLPTGANVGLMLDFTSNNLTINGLPIVDIQACFNDFEALEMLFEPSDVLLVDCNQPGSLQLAITPFVDLNGNCAYDDGIDNCLGNTTTVNVNVRPSITTILANDAAWTLADCAEEQQVCYSFNLLIDDFCNPADLTLLDNLLDVDFGALQDNLVSTTPYVEISGENSVFVEYCFNLSPEDAGLHSINLAYNDNTHDKCIDVSPKIQIIASQPNTDYESLSCPSEVNIRLDEECKAELTASEILKGVGICDENFCVHTVLVVGERSYINYEGEINEPFVYDNENDEGKTLNGYGGCGRYIYRVYVKNDDGSCGDIVCWGYVNAEDKSAPIFEYCPSDKFYGQRSSVVYEIVGELGDNDNDG
ncbi:MAG: right-handed parallel beta-helix repeat-containing protein, partial [Saprospiraceae bacterium]|nr:right-handed parallel beta-helix repeat-containing protein [Saprospiraceae bacterium]